MDCLLVLGSRVRESEQQNIGSLKGARRGDRTGEMIGARVGPLSRFTSERATLPVTKRDEVLGPWMSPNPIDVQASWTWMSQHLTNLQGLGP